MAAPHVHICHMIDRFMTAFILAGGIAVGVLGGWLVWMAGSAGMGAYGLPAALIFMGLVYLFAIKVIVPVAARLIGLVSNAVDWLFPPIEHTSQEGGRSQSDPANSDRPPR